MSDDFEGRLRDWLRERGQTSDQDLRALAGNVAVLPPRRPRRFRPLLAAAAVIMALVAGWTLVPKVGQVSGQPPVTAVPPDPAAFAGDPRLARCGVPPATASHAFEMAHARDYQRHLPAMLLAPELDVDDPAFVVVFDVGHTFGAGGGLGQTSTNQPGNHDVCILVGHDPATATPNIYGDIDVTGITAVADHASPGPEASHVPSTQSHVPASARSSPTRTVPTDEPAPAWAGDLLGALECEGAPQAVGYERGAGPPVGHEGTASPHPWLEAVTDVDLPLSGWIEEPRTSWENGASHFVRFVNEANGAVKAVVLMEGASVDGGRGSWDVTGFRACPPAEFDQSRGRTTDDAPWHDAAGRPVEGTHTMTGPGHCGWESSVWLRHEDRLYLRDPLGLFADVTVGDYEPSATLPSDAVPTGLSSIRWELYATDDPDAVWIVTDGHVERWPRSGDPFIGCM